MCCFLFIALSSFLFRFTDISLHLWRTPKYKKRWSTTILCLFVILLVFIVPFSASVKEKTEIKNMKTKQSTSHTQHHTIDITHLTSHTQHHTLNVTHLVAHTRHQSHYTLNITHSTSHTWRHTLDITNEVTHSQTLVSSTVVIFNGFNVRNGLILTNLKVTDSKI